jgi:hypothetical protein
MGLTAVIQRGSGPSPASAYATAASSAGSPSKFESQFFFSPPGKALANFPRRFAQGSCNRPRAPETNCCQQARDRSQARRFDWKPATRFSTDSWPAAGRIHRRKPERERHRWGGRRRARGRKRGVPKRRALAASVGPARQDWRSSGGTPDAEASAPQHATEPAQEFPGRFGRAVCVPLEHNPIVVPGQTDLAVLACAAPGSFVGVRHGQRADLVRQAGLWGWLRHTT